MHFIGTNSNIMNPNCGFYITYPESMCTNHKAGQERYTDWSQSSGYNEERFTEELHKGHNCIYQEAGADNTTSNYTGSRHLTRIITYPILHDCSKKYEWIPCKNTFSNSFHNRNKLYKHLEIKKDRGNPQKVTNI